METKANSISEVWEEFDRTCLLDKASDIQRTEMRKVFYAGALSILEMQLELSRKDLTDDVMALFLESWLEECAIFFLELTKQITQQTPKDIDRPV